MYRVYQVQTGETINSIANNLGTSRQIIIDLNNLATEVTPGQFLVVPNQQTVFTTYVVSPGDNMYQIATKFNVDVDDLLAINGLNKDDFIYPNQEILVPQPGVSVYVVKQNETLNEIARKLNVDPTALVGQNETIYLTPDQLIIYKR